MRAGNSCKKSLSLREFSVRVLWVFLMTPALAYANLVDNPSMEGAFIYQSPLGDVAEYWTGWRENDGDFDEGSYANDGTKSQRIYWSGWGYESFGPDGIYQQISSLQPRQIYKFSAWFKYHFAPVGMVSDSSIIYSIGMDPNGGTNPDVVTNWTSASDFASEWYEGPWFNLVTFFSPNATVATIFIKVNGYGVAEDEDFFCPEPPCPPVPAPWDAYCYIDDVVVQLIQIGQASTVTATTPVPANGASWSEVTITVLDSNSNPIEGIPPWEIDLNCSGSDNFIYGLDAPTDQNGQTTSRITSTVAETKTVTATVLGTVLSDTVTIYFCESRYSKLRASDGAASDYFGYSVSIGGDYAIIGAYLDDNSGSSYVFKHSGSTWTQQAKLTASDGAASDWFGQSVSISGDYAIVGAYGDDDNGSTSGSAYIFTPNSIDPNNWDQQAKLTASDGAASDWFGRSVSISGDYAIVGADGDDDNGTISGSAYIFTPNTVDPNNWDQQAKLTASDATAWDYFGHSVSISGDYAIVGAYKDDDNGTASGSAYIFAPNSIDPNNWDQKAKLTASDGAADDRFGYSVSISGDYAIVGAYYDDDNGSSSGSAYIFTPNDIDPNNWDQQAKLTAADGASYDYFGRSVSISGDYAIVGADGDDDNGSSSGSAYIFRRDGVNWIEQAKLTGPDAAAGDYFGRRPISISGDYAIVGAYGDDDNGTTSGSAYIFALLPADVDGDGDVDFADFSILASQWLQLPGQPSADIAPCGGDCIVDFWDLDALFDHWLE